MKLIIVGCGRVGSELAHAVVKEGHQVTVIDDNNEAFERLGTNFKGRTISGSYLDQEVLRRAGIEEADGLAAVSSDDATNFVVAQAAKEIFNVPNVVARAYDPLRKTAFETLGVQVVASSIWAGGRISQLLTHPGRAQIASLGHGEVLLIEQRVDPDLHGKPLNAFVKEGERYPVAVIRGGRAMLPSSDVVLAEDDLVIASVSLDFINAAEQVDPNPKEV